MTAKEKISEELDYAILNFELDINAWKIKINQENRKEYKEAMVKKQEELEETLEMLKLKRDLLKDV